MDQIHSGPQQEDYHQEFQGMEFVDLLVTKAFQKPKVNQNLLFQLNLPFVLHFLL
jgi:hypothetical protein